MERTPIDDYLAGLEPEQRVTLEELRRMILAVVPDAEESMAYGAPAFRIGGKAVAGFAAYKDHLSYLPHSGDVIATLKAAGDLLDGFKTSKGSVQFTGDRPLPGDVVEALIRTRLAELSAGSGG